jgi:hypothetical protein
VVNLEVFDVAFGIENLSGLCIDFERILGVAVHKFDIPDFVPILMVAFFGDEQYVLSF